MDSKPEGPASKRPVLVNWLPLVVAVAISAPMFYWGTGLHPVWWLTWLAPLPVLLVAARHGATYSFLTAVAAMVLGNLNLWHYANSAIQLPLLVTLTFLIFPACIFGLAVLAHRRFIRRGSLWKAAFVFPTLWVTYEFLNALSSPHSTFGNLGYTQMDFLPLIQIASLVGIWGVSFCMFLFPSTLAALLSNQPEGYGIAAQKGTLAAVVGAIVLGVLAFGSGRLLFTPPAENSIRIGLVAIGGANPFYQQKETGAQLIHGFSEQMTRFGAQGVQVIVMPEKILIVPDDQRSKFDSLVGETARASRSFVLAGLDRGSDTHRFNEVRVYSPDGTVAATYDKHHLLPQYESVDTPGTSRTIMNQPSGKWGIEICKDMDFPALSRQYGARGVGLLLVPAWDFTLDGWLHGRMAVLRGVESGLTIVRAAKQGVLTVSDDRGRILAQQDAATVPFASLIATAPIRHDSTLYVRWGDWFAWLNAAGLVTLLFSRARKTRSRVVGPLRVWRLPRPRPSGRSGGHTPRRSA